MDRSTSSRMFAAVFFTTVLAFHFQLAGAAYCSSYGHTCRDPEQCCGRTCCIPADYEQAYHNYRWNVWNMWYFWFIVIFLLMSCFGGCGYWRRRQILLAQQRHHMTTAGLTSFMPTAYGCSRQARVTPSMAVPVYPHYEVTYPVVPQVPNVGQPQATAMFQPSMPQATQMAPSATAGATSHPQGVFPEPPPYSAVAAKSAASGYGNEDLPPYPGQATLPHRAPAVTGPHGWAAVPGTIMFPWSQSQPTTTGLPPYTATSDMSRHPALQGAVGGYIISSQRQQDAAVSAYNPPQDPTQDTDTNGNEINSNTCPNNRNIVGAASADAAQSENREANCDRRRHLD